MSTPPRSFLPHAGRLRRGQPTRTHRIFCEAEVIAQLRAQLDEKTSECDELAAMVAASNHHIREAGEARSTLPALSCVPWAAVGTFTCVLSAR